MGGFLSRADKTETSIVDFISSVQKDGFKLQLPAFKIEPTTTTHSESSSIIKQWLTLVLITAMTYLIFVKRNVIMLYFKNLDNNKFQDDFNSFKNGAISKLSDTSTFVKTNIVDEIAEGSKTFLKTSYGATKAEVASIAKDSFSFVKNELTGNQQESDISQ